MISRYDKDNEQMQKFRVCHWRGHQPPHPRAVQESDIYTFQLTLDGIMTLVAEYDIMIRQVKGATDDLPVLWLDDKGGRFRQR